jgi:sigma-54 dependent transcriptional regulator, acetoin dehydrogenase operon transcriptional activator AcoR
MQGEDGLTATDNHHAGLPQPSELVPLLRWVHPARALTVLSEPSTVLGRDSALTTRLAGDQVSRRHAAVLCVNGSLEVRDLGSKNGSFVNGRRIERCALADGDVVRVGDCVGIVERVPAGGLPGFAELAPGLYGGAAMRAVAERAKRAASGSLNVVLQGETGTGKERFANALHSWSGRSGAFVAVNCANYTPDTAQAELFGYRKGAFTGAERANVGHVRAANRGTLLLDEVLDLPLEVQAKLLRVLEQREVLALGETTPVPVDVLFLAASQRPLGHAVAAGSFRADLHARLEGIVVEIPPLRARRSDVIPLFVELLKRHGFRTLPQMEATLVEQLCLEPWPLNVRQLENVARRAAALYAAAPVLLAAHFRELMPEAVPTSDDAEEEELLPPRRAVASYTAEEMQALRAALARHKDNLTQAAIELGITRGKAYRMLRSSTLPE